MKLEEVVSFKKCRHILTNEKMLILGTKYYCSGDSVICRLKDYSEKEFEPEELTYDKE